MAESNLPSRREKPCDFCGAPIYSNALRGRLPRYCARQECSDARKEQKRSMASGADRIGDSEGAKRRHESARANEQARAERDDKALERIWPLAERAVDRALDDDPCGEQQFIVRARTIGEAKRAQDWTGLEGALIDLAACCLSWAGRVDVAEGEAPLPAVRPALKSKSEPNGNGHKSVAERYADILLETAGADLDGDTARSTIERLIGVGI